MIQCIAPAPTVHRDLCLADLEAKLKFHNTYPPLADLIYEVISTQNLSPDAPVVANGKHILQFHRALHSQSSIGWDNFMRGLISKHWKSVQHAHYKWARMVIKTILEFHRSLWKIRCDIVATEKKASYEHRQRLDAQRLFHCLQNYQDEITAHTLHYLDKHESFFEQTSLDNILMWKRGLEVSLETNNMHRKTTSKQYFCRQRPAVLPPQKRKEKNQKQK